MKPKGRRMFRRDLKNKGKIPPTTPRKKQRCAKLEKIWRTKSQKK